MREEGLGIRAQEPNEGSAGLPARGACSTPCSLLATRYSLLPTPYSLLPTPYSLLPTPYLQPHPWLSIYCSSAAIRLASDGWVEANSGCEPCRCCAISRHSAIASEGR